MWDTVKFLLEFGLGGWLFWIGLAFFVYGKRWQAPKMFLASIILIILAGVWIVAAFGWFTIGSRVLLFTSILILLWLNGDIRRLLLANRVGFRTLLWFWR